MNHDGSQGISCIPMDYDGSRRITIDIWWFLWIPMNSYGSLLILMDPYWSLLIPIDDSKFNGSWLMPMFPNGSWWSKSLSLKSAWIRWWRRLCLAKYSLSWIHFSFDFYSFLVSWLQHRNKIKLLWGRNPLKWPRLLSLLTKNVFV